MTLHTIPLEPKGGPINDPMEYAHFKIDCLDFIMSYLGSHKKPALEKQILSTWQEASEFAFVACHHLHDDSNRIHNKFGAWVFCTIHLKNPHTIRSTGSFNTVIALILSQRLQVELLRMVVLECLDRCGDLSLRQMLGQKYAVYNPPLKLLYLDSTLLDPTTNFLMWRWLCLIASCFEDGLIIQVLHDYVANHFNDPATVAEHLYMGQSFNFCTDLDRYQMRYDKDFLVRYGVDLADIEYTNNGQSYEDTKMYIEQMIAEKDKWPS